MATTAKRSPTRMRRNTDPAPAKRTRSRSVRQLPVFYTLDEVAEIFQCSSRTVRRMVERDELHTVHIGRTPMVPAGEIDRIAQRAS